MAKLESTDLWVWVVCGDSAHGPYGSLADAWDKLRALRPYPTDRVDTRLVHAVDAGAAITAPTWLPRCD